MVLPSEVKIKEEVDFDINSNEENLPDDFTGPEYDIKLEIQVSGAHLDIAKEWCVKDEVIDTKSETFSEEGSTVCYEDLVDYCEQHCYVCYEKFWESYSLLRHNLKHLKVKLNNIDLRDKECTICNQYFISKSSRNKHMESMHWIKYDEMTDSNDNFKFKVTKMMHQCKICGKIQNYKTWHSHIKEVHGDRRYICTICNTSFTCHRYLRNHNNCIHLKNDLSIPCPQCPAKLKCKNALTTHIRNCHSEKVQCDICKSFLKSKSYLCAHIRRVHYVDGKKHVCDCGKSFRSSRYLRVHIKNAHSR